MDSYQLTLKFTGTADGKLKTIRYVISATDLAAAITQAITLSSASSDASSWTLSGVNARAYLLG